jgi:hypothetical protein
MKTLAIIGFLTLCALFGWFAGYTYVTALGPQ